MRTEYTEVGPYIPQLRQTKRLQASRHLSVSHFCNHVAHSMITSNSSRFVLEQNSGATAQLSGFVLEILLKNAERSASRHPVDTPDWAGVWMKTYRFLHCVIPELIPRRDRVHHCLFPALEKSLRWNEVTEKNKGLRPSLSYRPARQKRRWIWLWLTVPGWLAERQEPRRRCWPERHRRKSRWSLAERPGLCREWSGRLLKERKKELKTKLQNQHLSEK